MAILDATAITEMRTGAMTALGARHLARPDSRVLGHIGARGTAYWNVRLLDGCSTSTRSACTRGGPRAARRSPARLARDLGKPVRATADWERACEGADIVVEASRLSRPSRCCGRSGSRPARSSSPTAR